ncbi:MAG: DHH family phosphoesterase [Bacilli bacterium]
MQKKEFAVIKKHLKKSSNVFIMGHKDIDLDAFGSAIGMYCYASYHKKEAYVILDDKKLEAGVKKALETYEEKINIIKSREIDNLINDKSILFIVDVNKEHLLQNPRCLSKFNNIIVIDHHDTGKDSINYENALLFIDNESSSTCEIITKMLKNDNYLINSEIATTILAGIVLDTNNFVIKTDADTYYAAYYLGKCGADSRKVQYLLKQDIKEYIEMQKVITEVKIIKKIAISKGLQTRKYRREDLAKIADTILLFNNIEASFVIGKIDKGIGISARSMGKINVGKIMEEFGGGGDNHEAAARILDKSLNEMVSEITKIAKKL